MSSKIRRARIYLGILETAPCALVGHAFLTHGLLPEVKTQKPGKLGKCPVSARKVACALVKRPYHCTRPRKSLSSIAYHTEVDA